MARGDNLPESGLLREEADRHDVARFAAGRLEKGGGFSQSARLINQPLNIFSNPAQQAS